jgi:hypothetical protein
MFELAQEVHYQNRFCRLSHWRDKTVDGFDTFKRCSVSLSTSTLRAAKRELDEMTSIY